MGFSVHMADPAKIAEIYKTAKKNDREDSYKLAKRLRMHELPEVHLPSNEADSLRSIVRYRRSIGEDIPIVKNRVHAILTAYGIVIDKTDIFGVKGLRAIMEGSLTMRQADQMVLSDLLSRPQGIGTHIEAWSIHAQIHPCELCPHSDKIFKEVQGEIQLPCEETEEEQINCRHCKVIGRNNLYNAR